MENQEQRQEILKEGIPPTDMTNTHYYGTEEDMEADVEEDEGMETSQSPRSAQKRKITSQSFSNFQSHLGEP